MKVENGFLEDVFRLQKGGHFPLNQDCWKKSYNLQRFFTLLKLNTSPLKSCPFKEALDRLPIHDFFHGALAVKLAGGSMHPGWVQQVWTLGHRSTVKAPYHRANHRQVHKVRSTGKIHVQFWWINKEHRDARERPCFFWGGSRFFTPKRFLHGKNGSNGKQKHLQTTNL